MSFERVTTRVRSLALQEVAETKTAAKKFAAEQIALARRLVIRLGAPTGHEPDIDKLTLSFERDFLMSRRKWLSDAVQFFREQNQNHRENTEAVEICQIAVTMLDEEISNLTAQVGTEND